MGIVYASLFTTFPGIIVAVTIIVSVVAAGYFASKNETAKQAANQAEHWREAFESENIRAGALTEQLIDQREEKHRLATELATERHKTDLTGLMKLMQDSFDRTNKRIDAIEKRMSEGFDSFIAAQQAQTEALQAITKELTEFRK